jgi:hypothetical protein
MFRFGVLRDALTQPGADLAVDCAQAKLGMRPVDRPAARTI